MHGHAYWLCDTLPLFFLQVSVLYLSIALRRLRKRGMLPDAYDAIATLRLASVHALSSNEPLAVDGSLVMRYPHLIDLANAIVSRYQSVVGKMIGKVKRADALLSQAESANNVVINPSTTIRIVDSALSLRLAKGREWLNQHWSPGDPFPDFIRNLSIPVPDTPRTARIIWIR